jgi:hypothetical protein
MTASKKVLDLLSHDTAMPEARRDVIRKSAEERLARLQKPTR